MLMSEAGRYTIQIDGHDAETGCNDQLRETNMGGVEQIFFKSLWTDSMAVLMNR